MNSGADSSLERPLPRPPRSPAHAHRIRSQNRRRQYLHRHPSYYSSLDHELTNPVLYERLVKRFQTAAERTADAKDKGYGRTLEASLLRGEDTLAGLRSQETTATDTSRQGAGTPTVQSNAMPESAWDAPARDKEHGSLLWREYLEDRFVRGGDEDFDYSTVDADEDLDVMARDEEEEKWYEEEEPQWALEDDSDSPKKTLSGQTGVQDF